MKKQDSGSMVALRTLQILLLFQDRSELSLTEIAKQIGISNTAAYRLLSTLHDTGFLVRDDAKRYSLGPVLLKLARNVNPDLRGLAVPVLDEICKKTEESVYFSVSYDLKHIVFIAASEGKHPVKWSADIGVQEPINAGSVGKAHLAFCGEDLDSLLEHVELVRYTENTITDKELLRKELKKIQLQGYAFADGERFEGVIGISVPVFDSVRSNLLGVLSIFIPKFRWKPDKFTYYLSCLQTGAEQISGRA
jgi:DNA-binding IclR family transcriptional regulator